MKLNMNTSWRISIKEGTFRLDFSLEAPWPPQKPRVLTNYQASDGQISLTGEPSGRIRLRVVRPDGGIAMDQATCVLRTEGSPHIVLAFRWRLPDKFEAAINGDLVASALGERAVPEAYRVITRPLETPRDFSAENAEAMKARKSRMMGAHKKTSLEHATMQELMVALSSETQQTQDLLDLLQAGKLHHIGGLSARLRLLIAKGKDPLPLLQLCAAATDSPLVAFTERRPGEKKFKDAIDNLNFTIWWESTDVFDNPVDLDVWLDLPWGYVGDLRLTNRGVLIDIGNKVGSHYDWHGSAVTSALKAYASELHGTEVEYFVQYLCRVGAVSVALAKNLLSRYDAELP